MERGKLFLMDQFTFWNLAFLMLFAVWAVNSCVTHYFVRKTQHLNATFAYMSNWAEDE